MPRFLVIARDQLIAEEGAAARLPAGVRCERAHGAELSADAVFAQLGTPDLFAERRAYHYVNFLDCKLLKKDIERLRQILSQLPAEVTLVCTQVLAGDSRSDEERQLKGADFKLWSDGATVDDLRSAADGERAADWLRTRAAQRHGLKLTRPQAARIYALSGDNLALADSELSKLSLLKTGAEAETVSDATLAASLSDDTIYIATVTVSGGGIQSDTLRVGFYRSSAAEPTDVHAALDLSTSVQPAGLALDPIRPYVYVGLSTNTVRAVNIVTGAVLPLFTAAADAKIGRIAVSGDGQFLYASSIGSTGDVLRFNLDVGVSLAALPKVANCCAQELVWLRSRGVPLLVTGHFEVYNAETGAAQTPVNVPVDGLTKYDYLAGISDGSELWAIDNVSATGDACSRAASFHVVTRPADGSGYLTPFRSGPKIGLTSSCPSISQLASSSDGANVELIGQNAGGISAFFEGPRGGAVTEISSQRQYEHLAVGSSGLKALSFVAAGAFADGVEVLDATNSVVHTFEQLQGMEGVRFSSDDRFLLVLGNSQSASGDLHVLKIP
jgi:hypothetical protein